MNIDWSQLLRVAAATGLTLIVASSIALVPIHLIDGLWKHGSAILRSSIWRGAFVACALLIAISFARPISRQPVPTVKSWSLPEPSDQSAGMWFVKLGGNPKPFGTTLEGSVSSRQSASESPRLDLAVAAMLVWLGGAMFLLYRLLRDLRSIQGLTRHAWLEAGPVTEHVNTICRRNGWSVPPVYESPHVSGPMMVGILRPAFVVPEDFTKENPDHLDAIAAHELNHQCRADAAWRMFSRVICALLWPQPLVWTAARRLRQSDEFVSDVAALNTDCTRKQYAACLVRLADRTQPRSHHDLAPTVAGLHSTIGRRVERILFGREETIAMKTPIRLLLIAGIAVLTVTSLGIWRVDASPSAVTKTLRDDDSPQVVVNSLLNEIAKADFAAAAARVKGGDSKLITPDFAKQVKENFVEFSMKVISTVIQDDKATLKLQVTVTEGSKSVNPRKIHDDQNLGKKTHSIHTGPEETIVLEKSNGKWLIVPPKFSEMRGGADMAIVTTLASMFTNPEIVKMARQRAVASVCLSNGKQLALATIMYVQDHKETFPPDNAPWSSIKFYAGNSTDISKCPMTGIAFTFNKRLKGINIGKLSEPSQTVLYYEGMDEKAAYNHSGRATVTFADGHVKLMSPEEMKKVRWAP